MATRLATGQPATVQGQHTSGIFSDMTVDGPEIGTLVVIVDRAKNLPSRRSMGKQNPYCAARLGKEAKKTDTDKRGGQTPRWDQELRFTVHDSLDYHNLKVSVFSEDKKNDHNVYAWVNLDTVITPGGGQSDLWQTLNCKGKYSGEIRVELTYYDSRPKPEKRVVSQLADEGLHHSSSAEKVKRRPLPSGSRAPLTPNTIPEPLAPGRAKHGPRDFRTPPRANSMPPEMIPSQQQQQQQSDPRYQQEIYGSSPPMPYRDQDLPIPLHAEYQDKYPVEEYEQARFAQPDFLPTLPTLTPRQRQNPYDRQMPAIATSPAVRSMHQPTLPHAHSDPVIPQRDDFYHGADDQDLLYTATPDPLHDLDFQHHYVQQRQVRAQQWQDPSNSMQHYADEYDTPPRPPHHSRSTSALPSPYSPVSPISPSQNSTRFQADTPQIRPVSRENQQYVSNSSPLQSIERGDFDPHYSSPVQQQKRSPDVRSLGMTDGDTSSLQFRSLPGRGQPLQPRQSISSIQPQSFRPNPHPLSQEIPHERILPDQRYSISAAEMDRYRNDLDRNAITPIVRPRAISPARQNQDLLMQEQPERRRKSVYSIQNPVRAFESSDNNPLSNSAPVSKVSTPNAQPRFSGGVPFSPDSFDRPSSRNGPASNDGVEKSTITGWDGREIDPSDHLPVASWAPEPESKPPNRAYGLGRDRDFGPRVEQANGARLGKDVVVNVHRRGQSVDTSHTSHNTIKARLVKKNAPVSSPIAPLRDHPNYNPVPDPYAQQEYSSNFTNGGPTMSVGLQNGRYDAQQPYGVPSIPPKVPLEYGQDALTREIASIDLGAGARARVPAPTAYVPVRSHRDRNSFY